MLTRKIYFHWVETTLVVSSVRAAMVIIFVWYIPGGSAEVVVPSDLLFVLQAEFNFLP